MQRRGLTLLELVIALAVLAVLATLALPSFGALTARTRLKGAAEMLAGDVSEARFEAARRGQPLSIDLATGSADWCWAVTVTPGCACGQAQSCQLKAVHGHDHPGVEVLQAGSTQVQANGQARAASTLFQSAHGERLRVDVSPLGRASICAPAGRIAGYPDCP
jgi:type IV fimbrial biogenesis protein FimT